MSPESDGLEQMGARLQRAKTHLLAGMLDGIDKAGEHVLGVSNDHVPIEEGTLERSGKVTTTVDSSVPKVRASVSYDTPYAAKQHEDLTLKHDSGRNAKFLENAMNSERGTIGKIVASTVKEFLKKA